MSVTGGWYLSTCVWHLGEQFYCRTANTVIGKWIQLLLIFSQGFKPPQGINIDPTLAIPLVLRQRYRLQEFYALCIFVVVFHYTARMSNRRVRAVRQVHELLKVFTQNKLGDT